MSSPQTPTAPRAPDLHPDFAPRLHGRDLEALEVHPGTVYGLFPDGRLGYLNPAWHRFAQDNGAEPAAWAYRVGASIWPAIPKVLRRFYERGFARVLATGEPWTRLYACPSPERGRTFHMRVLSLDGDGLLVVHSPRLDVVRTPGPGDLGDDGRFRDPATGLVAQCAHCRCVRRLDVPGEVWAFVPAFVIRPPQPVSHGLCPACFAYHYPDTDPDEDLDRARVAG